MGNSTSHISGRKSDFHESWDTLSTTTLSGMDITLAKAPLKHILQSYSTGDISQVVATMPKAIIWRNTDFMSLSAKRLYREVSDIFLKHKADAILDPFSIKHVKLYEPCRAPVFIWSLPAEILIAIVALLGVQDLRCVTQLSAFSHFLQSVPHKSIRYITLFWNFDILTCSIFPHIASVLETIRAFGCEDLMCMGFYSRVGSLSVTGLTRIQGHVSESHLKTFYGSSQAFFSPKLLPFTIQTIRSSYLEKLRLSSIKLSPSHWDKLLRHLVIPMLVKLQVDANCAPSTLIHFLARHPGVDSLGIIPRPGCLWRAHRITASLTLLSVSMLDGPLSHVLAVLQSHLKPPTLTYLGLSLQSQDASLDYLTTILQCVSYCNSIGYLNLSLPVQGFSYSAMICPGTQSVVHVEHLAISSDAAGSCPALVGDALELSASWIEAFPLVKHVSMRGCSNLTAEHLIHIMCRFTAADVELSVKLCPEVSL
ncbi:uncharacterized protein F5891DRAFT_1195508 [Suillus fuscotomentosus]|uniref:F-box domain-containing protein n=1 Tax=Suillus fuscotomentosus TaxID=1912939 RepID=A0AAD4DUU3_9AGAM|nr:uncharacterized protein F5891DRAFT_1195508 [Suillus fuscotomentosus]KAG1894226.1 hypothetical protein F5891DRAFT_1195508 [Suillus fuscotomentosus]